MVVSDDDSLRNFFISTIESDEDEAVDETYEPGAEDENEELTDDESEDASAGHEPSRVDTRELQALLKDASLAIPGSAPPLTTTLPLASFRSEVTTPRALELLREKVKAQLASHVQLLVQTMLLSSEYADPSLSAPYGKSCGLLLELRAHAVEARRNAVVRDELARSTSSTAEDAAETHERLTRLRLHAARRAELTLDAFGGAAFGGYEAFESILNEVERCTAAPQAPGENRARHAIDIVKMHGLEHSEALVPAMTTKLSPPRSASSSSKAPPLSNGSNGTYNTTGGRSPLLLAVSSSLSLVAAASSNTMSFTAAEDRLLLRGVQLHGAEDHKFGQIAEALLPPKSRELVIFRYASLTNDAAPPNVFKDHKHRAARASAISTRWDDADDELLALTVGACVVDRGDAFDAIAADLMPHRSRLEVKKRWAKIEDAWRAKLDAKRAKGDDLAAEAARAAAALRRASQGAQALPAIWDDHLPQIPPPPRPVLAPPPLVSSSPSTQKRPLTTAAEPPPTDDDDYTTPAFLCSDATRGIFEALAAEDDDHNPRVTRTVESSLGPVPPSEDTQALFAIMLDSTFVDAEPPALAALPSQAPSSKGGARSPAPGKKARTPATSKGGGASSSSDQPASSAAAARAGGGGGGSSEAPSTGSEVASSEEPAAVTDDPLDTTSSGGPLSLLRAVAPAPARGRAKPTAAPRRRKKAGEARVSEADDDKGGTKTKTTKKTSNAPVDSSSSSSSSSGAVASSNKPKTQRKRKQPTVSPPAPLPPPPPSSPPRVASSPPPMASPSPLRRSTRISSPPLQDMSLGGHHDMLYGADPLIHMGSTQFGDLMSLTLLSTDGFASPHRTDSPARTARGGGPRRPTSMMHDGPFPATSPSAMRTLQSQALSQSPGFGYGGAPPLSPAPREPTPTVQLNFDDEASLSSPLKRRATAPASSSASSLSSPPPPSRRTSPRKSPNSRDEMPPPPPRAPGVSPPKPKRANSFFQSVMSASSQL